MSVCKNIIISLSINNTNLDLNLIKEFQVEGIEIFNKSNPFFTDQCKNYDYLYYVSKIASKLNSINQIKEYSESQLLEYIDNIDDMMLRGSGLIFDKITKLTVQTGKIKKTRAGSYIKTPDQLKLKRAIVNI